MATKRYLSIQDYQTDGNPEKGKFAMPANFIQEIDAVIALKLIDKFV